METNQTLQTQRTSLCRRTLRSPLVSHDSTNTRWDQRAFPTLLAMDFYCYFWAEETSQQPTNSQCQECGDGAQTAKTEILPGSFTQYFSFLSLSWSIHLAPSGRHDTMIPFSTVSFLCLWFLTLPQIAEGQAQRRQKETLHQSSPKTSTRHLRAGTPTLRHFFFMFFRYTYSYLTPSDPCQTDR